MTLIVISLFNGRMNKKKRVTWSTHKKSFTFKKICTRIERIKYEKDTYLHKNVNHWWLTNIKTNISGLPLIKISKNESNIAE